MRRFALAVLMMLAAKGVPACSGRAINPEDVLTNEPACSANGRFCAIVRWYPVADFKSEPAEVAFARQQAPSDRPTTALYEGRTLISTMNIEPAAQAVLVADSGRYVVAVHGARGMCGYRMTEDTVLAEIHKADGTLVATLKAIDLLTPYDVEQVKDIHWEIRPVSDVREVLVMHADDQERPIDLATGAFLEPKRAIYAPRVVVAAADGTHAKPFEPSQCAAAFDAPDVVRVSSQGLLARAVEAPAPEYPTVARKARIALPVLVDVLVSESGEVLCTRSTAGVFGLKQAAERGVGQWHFRRSRSKVAGEVVVRFELAP